MNKYLKFLLISLIFVIPCVIAVLIYNDKITQNSPVYYKQGVNFYNEGDYQNAYYNFGKIKRISPLYTMAIYKQAKSAQKVGDFAMASLKYKLFLDKNPNSIFSQTARYNLAKCYFYLKKYDEAKVLFTESKNKRQNQSYGEDFYLGLIEKSTNKTLAIQHFIDYLKEDRKDKANEIIAAEELSNLSKGLNTDERLLIGKTYYNNQKYTEALEYFSSIPMSMCWDYLVLSNHFAGNKIIAKKLIESGLNKYSVEIDEDNLYKIYDIYTSYLTSSKLNNWNRMLSIIQLNNLKGEDYVLYKIAGISNKEKALLLYSKIESKYPDSKYAPESLWNIIWSKYSKKDYTSAEKLALKHLQTYKNVNSTTRVAFWLAKTQLKLNKTTNAHNVLSKIISKYPDDYYALRADYIINKKNDFWTTSSSNRIPLPSAEELEFPISLSHLDIKDLKLINTLFEMGDYEIWLDANFESKIVESWFELRKDKKALSATLARDAIKEMEVKPSFLSAAYKLAYPRHWVQEINIAGQKLGLDPYYIIALIKEESHFDEFAKSSTNAQGLMQLMPSTANYIIAKLNIDFPVLANIQNPRTNMYLGCNYLKYLKDRFNDDLLVTAAYNGGEGSVIKWVTRYSTKDYDEFIENIPYDETRNYVKKVFRSYHLYKKIYE